MPDNKTEIQNPLEMDILLVLSPERISIDLPIKLREKLTVAEICKLLSDITPFVAEKIAEKLKKTGDKSRCLRN